MRRTAFTLIELLTVIAVIAMLSGILVPLLGAAREQARAVTCGSNLKQLFSALAAYDHDNGTFPYGFDASGVGMVMPPPRYPGNASYDWPGWWWFMFLAENLRDEYGKGSVFWCPSRNIKDPGLKVNILCGNYGVNRAICKDALPMGSEFVGTPLSQDKIRRPADTLLIADSGYSLTSWQGATNGPIQVFENTKREGSFYVPGLRTNKDRSIFPGQERDAIDGRHLKKSVNVGFAGGHVSRLKAADLLVEKIDHDYTNRSPLWLPE